LVRRDAGAQVSLGFFVDLTKPGTSPWLERDLQAQRRLVELMEGGHLRQLESLELGGWVRWLPFGRLAENLRHMPSLRRLALRGVVDQYLPGILSAVEGLEHLDYFELGRGSHRGNVPVWGLGLTYSQAWHLVFKRAAFLKGVNLPAGVQTLEVDGVDWWREEALQLPTVEYCRITFIKLTRAPQPWACPFLRVLELRCAPYSRYYGHDRTDSE
jgi:hypothetical protein